MNKKLSRLIELGIPIQKAVLLNAVNVPLNAPERELYLTHTVQSRKVGGMWLTSAGLVFEQIGKYKIVPVSNVMSCDPVAEERNNGNSIEGKPKSLADAVTAPG